MAQLLSFDWFLLLRLAAATLLGGIIGLERGGNRHAAGLRTHTILCLGAASVMVLSECLTKQYNIPSEVMRMGAQVISGVGFLGVGSIIIDGNKVRGITTAAGLWTTACVGLAVGAGYYPIALAMVVLVLFATVGLKSLAKRLQGTPDTYTVKLSWQNDSALQAVLQRLGDQRVEITSIQLNAPEEGAGASLELKPPRGMTIQTLTLTCFTEANCSVEILS